MNKKNKQANSQKQKKAEMKNRVLFFDDEPFISRALAENLKILGWDVTLVSEINEVFRCLENDQYNILILDIMAPIPSNHNECIDFTEEDIDEMNGGMSTGIVLSKIIWKLPSYMNLCGCLILVDCFLVFIPS